MQHEEGARFLSSMARQARKHYLGLTTVTQDVEDFLATPEGHTVLANSSVQLLMRQDSSTIDAVRQTFRLSAGEREFLLSCRKGEGLFFARGTTSRSASRRAPWSTSWPRRTRRSWRSRRRCVMVYDIDGIKQRNPIEEVVAGTASSPARSGERLIGRCPFHEDEHPSLVVYPETRSFYCFGCGAGGDVIDFVRRAEGLGFREALERLGQDGGRPPAGCPRQRRGTAIRIGAASATPVPGRPHDPDGGLRLYHETLLRTPEALRYLEERGVGLPVVRRCRLGYSDGRSLRQYLQRRRLSLRRATEMGLLWPRTAAARRWPVASWCPSCAAASASGWSGGRWTMTGSPKYRGLSLPKPILGYERVRGRPRVFVTEGAFD